ncbi:eukaryotic integral membrane protein-domain-containing protein [Phascolomyces articulosus]|uniref:Eukaryotic integral membrane protein-domain-containing protein n=1 Tax=Phascolomyces articulosus TaxID=60185 RepID=A0AAD5PKD2_9FUNG|nr:eukaryotic integral membrane protein-domain-containing protein [Phascolomyces articulosus]
MATSATLKSAFSNIPPLTKALVTSLIVLSCASYIYIYRLQLNADDPDAVLFLGCPFIGVLPGLALYAPWTFLTGAFYEDNVITLVLSSVVLLFCGKYLERAWGSRELLKYVLLTATVSNIATWIGLIATFYISGEGDYLYQTQINGMAGVFSAFLVAFKHLIPEHRISLMGNFVTIRVKNLIGVATASSIVCLILFQAIVFYNLVNIGWVVGWIYIRFFKYQDGIKGDHSETFAFVTFFPDFLHPIIGFVANHVYKIFVRLGVCTPAPRNYSYDLESQTGVRSMPSPLPGSARAEAERRRALALKALDMRLSSKATATASSSSSSSPANNNNNSSSSPVISSNNTDNASSSNSGAAAPPRGSDNTTVLFEAEEMVTTTTTTSTTVATTSTTTPSTETEESKRD